MLSINANQHVNFKSIRTDKNNELSQQNIERTYENIDSIDSFESSAKADKKPKGWLSKTINKVMIGAALIGGVAATTPKAEAQTSSYTTKSGVIVKKMPIFERIPSAGTYTCYYSKKPTLDSMIIVSLDGKIPKEVITFESKTKEGEPGNETYTITDKFGSKQIFKYKVQTEANGENGRPSVIDRYGNEQDATRTLLSEDKRPIQKRMNVQYQYLNNQNMIDHKIESKAATKNLDNGRFIKLVPAEDPKYGKMAVAYFFSPKEVLDSMTMKTSDHAVTKFKYTRANNTKQQKHTIVKDSNGWKTSVWKDFDNLGRIIRFADNNTIDLQEVRYDYPNDERE